MNRTKRNVPLRQITKDKTHKQQSSENKNINMKKRKILVENSIEESIPLKARKPNKNRVTLKVNKKTKTLASQKKSFITELTTIHYKPKLIDNFIHKFLNPIEIEIVSSDDDEIEGITRIEEFMGLTDAIAQDFKDNLHIIKPVVHNLGLKQNIVIDSNKKRLNFNNIDNNKIEEIQHNDDVTSTKNEENLEILNDSILSINDDCEYVETGRNSIQKFEDGIALMLEVGASIHMYGLIEISVLHGAVDILGNKLDILSPTVKVYSPRGTAFLSIKNLDLEDRINKKHLTSKLHEAGLLYTQANEFVKQELHPKMAVLICKRLSDKQTSYLKENVAQTIYPFEEDTLHCVFRNFLNNEWSVVNINTDWYKIVDGMLVDSRVMLCGGKGVGKSTAMRFMINRLLDRFQQILVIDLDPGQPEFTVSGCISSTIVKNPLLGPSYTHLTKPEKSILVPNIDVNNDYVNYLLCVKELMKISQKLRNMPTIINFMGFTRGIGINITASAIAEVLPTMVIQIDNIKNQSQNYVESLTCENVKKFKSLLTPNNCNDIKYQLLTVPSNSKGGKWELNPKQVREMCILSYISQMLPENCDYLTEKGVKIYKIALSDIKIVNNGKECSPLAVNANIVSLCSIHTYVNDIAIFNCHGWGVVRGISEEFNFLNLLTPLSIDELEDVDYLVLGSTTLPPSVYFRNNDKVKGLVPYVYHGTVGEFARTPRRSIKPKN